MVDVLIVENLWFAFGAHLLHIKWAMMYALKRNYRFYYKNNNIVNEIFFLQKNVQIRKF